MSWFKKAEQEVEKLTSKGEKNSAFWQVVAIATFIWALACSFAFFLGIPAYWWVFWQVKKKGWPAGIWASIKPHLFPNKRED